MRLALLAVLAMLGAGCAGLPERPRDVVDTASVSAVESAARNQGNQVIWLRYPTRSSEEAIVIVTVTTTIPRRSPEEVEAQVTIPLERRLAKLAGVQAVRSRSDESQSYFEVTMAGIRSTAAMEAVRTAVAAVRPALPAEAADPRISTVPTPTMNFAPPQ